MDYQTPTTELEAVNEMLSLIGELPVDDLNLSATNADVKTALRLLRNETRSLQLTGWQFNTDLDKTLPRDPDGSISLPSGCVKATKAAAAMEQSEVLFAVRGQKLYDRTKNSFAWDRDLRCDLVMILAFEDLPEAVRNFLMIAAGRKFQERYLGSQTLDGFTESDAQTAREALQEYELDTGSYNFLADSWDVVGIWAR